MKKLVINKTRLIAVDFDQTICKSKFPDFGPPEHGVREALKSLRNMEYKIMVYSCRTSYNGDKPTKNSIKQKSLITSYMKYHKLPYDVIYDGIGGKPFADFYIDDRAIRYENNWKEIVDFIKYKNKES